MAAPEDNHPVHSECSDAWQMVRDCLSGSRQIKKQGEKYLPRGNMKPTDYVGYIKRAVFFNALKRTLQAFVGLIFRNNPVVVVPGEAAEMQDFLNDATLTGKSFYDVSKETVRACMSVGKRGTIIDWKPAPEDRVFVIPYEAEYILDWDYKRVNGKTVLGYIKFHEVSNEYAPNTGDPTPIEHARQEYDQERIYEIMDADTSQPWVRVTVRRRKFAKEKSKTKIANPVSQDWVTVDTQYPMRGGKALTRIPFVPHGPEVNELESVEVPLESIADINISLYRSSADLKNALHIAGVPTPIFAGFELPEGQTMMQLGTHEGIVTNKENAKAYFLAYDSSSVSGIVTDMDNEKAEMAALGARMLEKQGSTGSGGQPEAFQTVLARQSGDHSALMSATIACTQSLTMVLLWAYWWNNRDVEQPEDARDKVYTELNTKFVEAVMNAQNVNAVWSTYMGGGMSFDSWFAWCQEAGIIPSERTMEEEIQLIENDPVKLALMKQTAQAEAEAQATLQKQGGGAGDEE